MKGLFFALLVVFGVHAHAQDYGVLLGVHETTATVNVDGLSTSGDFNFKLGLAASFPLTANFNFRSGIIYDQRHFDLKDNFGNKGTANMDYIDIPLLVQYNVVPMFGIFGGLVAAVNVNHSFSLGDGSAVSGTKGFIPLVQVGVNATFNDEFGIELYYERGLGDFATNLNSFSTYGLNFLYWF